MRGEAAVLETPKSPATATLRQYADLTTPGDPSYSRTGENRSGFCAALAETTARAIAVLDAQFPWLCCAEKGRSREPAISAATGCASIPDKHSA
jgi:hypothetical protein